MTLTLDLASLGIGFAIGLAVPCVLLFFAVIGGR
jgi:hypothetical protein